MISQREDRPSVTAIVVGYNHADCLARCLDSLVHQRDLGALQVIYIDNASKDGSPELAARYPSVLQLRNDSNRGFAHAVNQGLARARWSLVALVNPDIVLEPLTLRQLVEVLRARPEVGLVGATLVNAIGAVHPPFAPYPTLRALLGARIGWTPSAEKGWTTGALLVMETALLRELGGLEERYFVYGEDMDLCYRVQRAGRTIRVDPKVRVFHRGNPSWTADRLIRTYGAYLRFAGLHLGQERLSLGALLTIRWLTRGLAAGEPLRSLISGLDRIWSMRPDLPLSALGERP
jgi:N-acetylglucosaminyl-diphospho-decaprenol L-rhamnosyltransferase